MPSNPEVSLPAVGVSGLQAVTAAPARLTPAPSSPLNKVVPAAPRVSGPRSHGHIPLEFDDDYEDDFEDWDKDGNPKPKRRKKKRGPPQGSNEPPPGGGDLDEEVYPPAAPINDNVTPLTLSLAPATIEEGLDAGSLVGGLSIDPIFADVSYELVSGDGDDNNSQFAIAGQEVDTAEVLDLADGTPRTIRVRARAFITPAEGERAFEIEVTGTGGGGGTLHNNVHAYSGRRYADQSTNCGWKTGNNLGQIINGSSDTWYGIIYTGAHAGGVTWQGDLSPTLRNAASNSVPVTYEIWTVSIPPGSYNLYFDDGPGGSGLGFGVTAGLIYLVPPSGETISYVSSAAEVHDAYSSPIGPSIVALPNDLLLGLVDNASGFSAVSPFTGLLTMSGGGGGGYTLSVGYDYESSTLAWSYAGGLHVVASGIAIRSA